MTLVIEECAGCVAAFARARETRGVKVPCETEGCGSTWSVGARIAIRDLPTVRLPLGSMPPQRWAPDPPKPDAPNAPLAKCADDCAELVTPGRPRCPVHDYRGKGSARTEITALYAVQEARKYEVSVRGTLAGDPTSSGPKDFTAAHDRDLDQQARNIRDGKLAEKRFATMSLRDGWREIVLRDVFGPNAGGASTDDVRVRVASTYGNDGQRARWIASMRPAAQRMFDNPENGERLAAEQYGKTLIDLAEAAYENNVWQELPQTEVPVEPKTAREQFVAAMAEAWERAKDDSAGKEIDKIVDERTNGVQDVQVVQGVCGGKE